MRSVIYTDNSEMINIGVHTILAFFSAISVRAFAFCDVIIIKHAGTGGVAYGISARICCKNHNL